MCQLNNENSEPTMGACACNSTFQVGETRRLVQDLSSQHKGFEASLHYMGLYNKQTKKKETNTNRGDET